MKAIWKLSEGATILLIALVLVGLGTLAWLTLQPQQEKTTQTAFANTRPTRATREALTQTASAKQTLRARQTRRAKTAVINNAQDSVTEEPIIKEPEPIATATRDPRTPTIGPATPEPTSIVHTETTTPWPSPTTLPSVPTEKRQGLWVENLTFAEPRVLTSDVANIVSNVTFSPDGSRVALSGFTGKTVKDENTGDILLLTQIVVINLSSSEVFPIGDGINPIWSPDAKYIAAMARGNATSTRVVKVLDVEKRETKAVIDLETGIPASQYVWLSSSELALYREGQPQVFDVETNKLRQLFDESVLSTIEREFPLVFFTGAQSEGIFAVAGKEILIFEWSDSEAQVITRIRDGLDHGSWAMSPDGEWVAFVPLSGIQIRIVSVSDPQKSIDLPESSRGRPVVQGWSPDSASLFYVDAEGVEVVNRDGTGLQNMAQVEARWPPVWSPNGDRVVWVGSDSQLYVSSIGIK